MNWISVTKNLPEYDKKVLVYGIPKGQSPQMGNPFKVVIARRQNLKGTSLEKGARNYQDANEFSSMDDVTHWQPLPEAPTRQPL